MILISSLDRKVIDIDVFDSCLNKVYLITNGIRENIMEEFKDLYSVAEYFEVSESDNIAKTH